ncbi:unnamed protein product [Calypogeia fissa]
MAARMVSMMQLFLSFWLLLLPLPILAPAPASQLCMTSSCSTTGEKNVTTIGQQYSQGHGLEEDLFTTKLSTTHRPNLDQILLKTSRRGMKAELIRYHHHPSDSQPNSSGLCTEINRSIHRGRILKTNKKTSKASSVKGAAAAAGGKNYEDQHPLGLHTDLTTGAPFEYLMKISIGTPAQHLVAVADTGSDLVWLQCTPSPSSRLGQQQQQTSLLDNKHVFSPSNSTTFSKLACNSKPCHLLSMQYTDWISCSGPSRCHYSYFYADNSSSMGDLVVDTLHMRSATLNSTGQPISSASVHNFAFGCGHNQYSTSMLYVNANGVVGLGRGPLSFPSQLGAQFGRRFSYCLVDREKSSLKSSPILFGNIAVPTLPGVQYTPFLDNPVYPSYYYIGLKRIEVGDKALDIPSSVFELNFGEGGGEGGTLIDSGTTFSQLVAPAYTALLQALSSRIKKYKRVAGYFDFCYDVTGISRNLIVVPRISFHFHGGAKLDLPFKNSFILVPNDPVMGRTTMCLAMNNSTDLGFSIIGNYQQTNHQILYDLQEKRLGFVPRQCG